MLVIRPVNMNDLEPVLGLANLTSFGLTTLPRDRQLLESRIGDSLRAFEHLAHERPRGETYLFVLEDLDAARVVGTCGIVTKTGGFEPFYAYRIETSIHESKMLKVRKEIRTLHLVMEHNGPCEIGSLFLHPDYRKDGNGRTLSLARFLFIAEHPGSFDPRVIAEMRGVIDEHGRSAFWDALGRHFFDISFPKADYLSIVNKEFIGDLMPRHPIYIPLLPEEAQQVIGRVHQDTAAALRILEKEGFKSSGMVDIFEAGPIVICPRDEIRAVRQSRTMKVAQVIDPAPGGVTCVLSNAKAGFRACRGTVQISREGVSIGRDVADALEVGVGDAVRYVTMRVEDTAS